MSLWKIRRGDTERFALELSFERDPDAGRGADGDMVASWGSFQVWVNGRNLCTHNDVGERSESVHWYLLPLIEWVVDYWDPMFHEQRLPRQECRGADAWQALHEHAWPPPGLTEEEEDAWLSDWQAWRERHSIAAARAGGLFPDLVIRRWQQEVELSWGPTVPVGCPDTFRFVDRRGCLRLNPLEVAEPLHQALGEAIGWLRTRETESSRLMELEGKYRGLCGPHHQKRLAWLAGLVVDRWQRFTEAVRHRFADAAEAVEALLEVDGDLVLTGSCRAPVMFGTLSPTVGESDLLEIAGWQIAAWGVPRDERTVDRLARDEAMSEPPWRQGYDLAERLLEECDLSKTLPVPVDELLDRLGIQVVESTLEDVSIRGLAFVSPQHRPTILINKTHPSNMDSKGRRFTLAHELCHLLHDRTSGQELALASGPWTSLDVEQRATAFAAMLLMPVDALLEQRERGVRWDDLEGVRQLAQKLETGFVVTLEHLTNLELLSAERRAAIIDDAA